MFVPTAPTVEAKPGLAALMMKPATGIPFLALLVLLGGWLGLKLAVPPGDASPIWPPAGIGLAALLIWGWRTWPGLWLGSFVLNVWLVTEGILDQLTAPAVWAAIGISIGSTAQALAALWLLRPWTRRGAPPPLDTLGSITAFILLAGPLACLIAPSCAVFILYALDRIPDSALFFCWWNWWVGDSLGVIIIAPLMFCLFPGIPGFCHTRRLTAGPALAVSLVAVITVFAVVFQAEKGRLQMEMNAKAEAIGNALDALPVNDHALNPALLAERALKGFDRKGLHVSLRDLDAPVAEAELYAETGDWQSADGYGLRDWRRTVKLGNRNWQIQITPDLGFVADNSTWLPWTTLTGGLMFSGLFSVYLLLMSGKAAQAQALVRQRTDDLERLRESEERIRLLVEQSVDGILVHDAEGRYVEANPAACRILGYSREEILCLRVPDLVAEDGIARIVSDEARFSSGRVVFSEYRCRRKDGSIFIGEVTGRKLPDGRFLGMLRDITERKKAEAELRLAHSIYQHSSEGMLVTDADNRILAVNPAFTALTGYGPDEVVGRNPNLLRSGRHGPEFYFAMWRSLLDDGHWQGEIWSRRKDGEVFPEWLTINTIYSAEGEVHRRIALFTDISEKKRSEEIIWMQANFDSLTGLPNRALFQDLLEREIKRSEREHQKLALLFLDLDRFKEVNDTLGHQLGDELLKMAARRLRSCVRESDLVARMGGDEFTAILPCLHEASDIGRVARSMTDIIAQPFQLDDHLAYVSVSIGVTVYPDDGEDAKTLIKQADQAMYAAKNQGRNRFFFFTPMLQRAAEYRTRLLQDLREAVARQEFEVYYQPIIDLGTGRITKAEALIRWHHPRLGFVSPTEFIPIAEEAGLIGVIGNWVFQRAVRQLKAWHALTGPHFQMSVNKSSAQFRDSDYAPGRWLDYLDELRLPRGSVVVEITEGVLLDGGLDMQGTLFKFRDVGIQVAIDDFGTGYSSLSYLNKFEIDYLKIDQSFTRNLAPDSSDLALSEAIVVMAHKLGLKVITEGVETEAQRDLLMGMGCDYAQGFLFAKPLPAQEFEKLLREMY